MYKICSSWASESSMQYCLCFPSSTVVWLPQQVLLHKVEKWRWHILRIYQRRNADRWAPADTDRDKEVTGWYKRSKYSIAAKLATECTENWDSNRWSHSSLPKLDVATDLDHLEKHIRFVIILFDRQLMLLNFLLYSDAVVLSKHYFCSRSTCTAKCVPKV